MDRKQCKAARALLEWTQKDLATISDVAKHAIVEFERDVKEMSPAQHAQVVRTFYRFNVKFTDGGAIFFEVPEL